MSREWKAFYEDPQRVLTNKSGFSETEFRKAYENEWVPESEEELIYIVAGTQKQASQFARKHGIYPPKWRYVEGRETIKTARGSVMYVGSYFNRQDLMDIKEEVSIAIEVGRLKVVEVDD